MTDSPKSKFEIEAPDPGILRDPEREAARKRLLGPSGATALATMPASAATGAGSKPAGTKPPSSPPAPKDRQGARWFNGILLFVLGVAAVMGTQRKVGYAWDEAYYYEPARAAAKWIEAVVVDRQFIGSWADLSTSIDAYWGERSEHPSFQKILSGFSLMYLGAELGEIQAMRLPMAILFGFSLWLIYALGKRAFNGAAGFIAALAYLAIPHVFGHAHFAALETPLVFSTLLLTYCAVRGRDSTFWAVMTGPALGLLLATKINGFFMIPTLLIWNYIYARPRAIHSFTSMLLLGPFFFVLLWPWLWPDPVGRTLEYLTFHAGHQMTAVYFMGEKFGYDSGHLAPVYYPALMAAFATPVSVIALAAVGLLGSIVWVFKRPAVALFLLVAIANLGVASMPGTPKYDGVRLFLPFFPFLALLAGGGAYLFVSFGRWMDRRKFPATLRSKYFKLFAWMIGLGVLADGGAAIGLSHPFYLGYFNPAVLLAGGWKQDEFEITYWGEVVNEDVLAELNKESVLPRGAKLKVLALHELCFKQLQDFGLLRKDLLIGGEPPYDYHLLLHRRGFFARPERALAESGRFPPIYELNWRGSTLLSLHKTGPDFEAYWPTMPVTGEAPPPNEPEGAPEALPTPETTPEPEAVPSPVHDPGPESSMPPVHESPTSATLETMRPSGDVTETTSSLPLDSAPEDAMTTPGL